MRGSGGSVRLFVSLGLAFAFVLGFSFVASAQIQNATFTGTVTDPSGAVIPGATVTITNVGTNLTATVDTDSGGLYRAAELPVGSYKIEVSASGFKTAVKTGLFLSAGTIARVDFSLEVGAKTEVVTVEALATLVQTDDSRLYETVGSGRVASLPLNGRNVYALIQLAPGAVNVAGVSFENGQGTVVNGLRPNFNGFLINGVSNKGLSGGTSGRNHRKAKRGRKPGTWKPGHPGRPPKWYAAKQKAKGEQKPPKKAGKRKKGASAKVLAGLAKALAALAAKRKASKPVTAKVGKAG